MQNAILPGIKLITGFAVGSGVGTIVGSIVKNNLPSKMNFVTKITVPVGNLFLGGALSALAASYADKTIDSIVTSFDQGKRIAEDITREAIK